MNATTDSTPWDAIVIGGGAAGLWAAGNVVTPWAQVVTAIGMTAWLLERELSAAVGAI
ncbi:hypothetical protein AB0L65_54545 [Nonomuraea sp. NPDC052116]|uniref:hypothetical protein n=1 Tax=Nonomuraea sp. NPDC052116 TaxID=3155665 RepID=UPI0034196EF7